MPKIGLTYETDIGCRVTKATKQWLEAEAARNFRSVSMHMRMLIEQSRNAKSAQHNNVKQITTKKQDACEPAR